MMILNQSIGMTCRICGNTTNNKEFTIKEMMFGLKDDFLYLECSKCGCLQILNPPKDISQYYPANFYSFHYSKTENLIKNFLRKKRNEYAVLKKGIIGWLVSKIYGEDFLFVLGKTKVTPQSRILDVGSGSGRLLHNLSNIGFKNLYGIDPYINKEINDSNVNILRKEIQDLQDDLTFDLIIFKSSFEHIYNQLDALNKANELLTNEGICIISMPIKNRYIWEKYGTNWVQIDAPRHYLIHTIKSFKYLIQRTGFYIDKIIFESNEFQFWGSEQYNAGIPLTAKNSYLVNPKKSLFSNNQIKQFKNKAKNLNKKQSGDQASFIIIKK